MLLREADITKNLSIFISHNCKEARILVARPCTHWRVLLIRIWHSVIHFTLGFYDIFRFELKKLTSIQRNLRLAPHTSHVDRACVALF